MCNGIFNNYIIDIFMSINEQISFEVFFINFLLNLDIWALYDLLKHKYIKEIIIKNNTKRG